MSEANDPGPPRRSMNFSINDSGEIETSYAGETSDGEGNVAEVANLVVILLNEWGEGWTALRSPDGAETGADMIADGPLGRLHLQVTRVPRDPTLWRKVATDGHVSRAATPEQYAFELIEAIRHKALRYSGEVRAKTVLVLDGQRSMAFDFPLVLHAFTRLHLTEAQSHGFDDVFLLGANNFINLLVPQEDADWFRIG